MHYTHYFFYIETLEQKYNLKHEQLDHEIEEEDFVHLANYFDNVELYLKVIQLSTAEQQDIRVKARNQGTQLAMMEWLSKWKQHNPHEVTIRGLLDILLSQKKENIASNVVHYFYPKPKCSTLV